MSKLVPFTKHGLSGWLVVIETNGKRRWSTFHSQQAARTWLMIQQKSV